MASHSLILFVAISLVPPLLNAAFKPSPVTFLWASPLFFLIWSLCIPLLYLLACFLLDVRPPARSSSASPSSEQLRTLSRLTFLSPAAWSAHKTRLRWTQTSFEPDRKPIYPSSPHFSDAFDHVLHLIMRDFVLKWHTSLSTGSPNPSSDQLAPEFPRALEHTIRSTLENIKAILSELDPPNLVVRQLLPKVTAHLDSYRRAEIEFRGSSDNIHLSNFGSDQIDLFLASKYESGKLHPAVGDMSSLHTKAAEQAFLRRTIAKLLQVILPYPEIESPSIVIVVREIISCTILFPVIDMISDPDFWNNLLEQKAGAVIHEQILVGKLREALDKQDPATISTLKRSQNGTRNDGPSRNLSVWPAQEPKKPDQRSFDSFLKSIQDTSSLLEARRTKNDVAVQIRKTKTNLERLSDDPDNATRSKLQSYLRRLETAYALADAKILELGPNKGVQASHGKVSAGADPHTSRVKLHDVLLNPSSLSFFMEFMDRRKRAILVQFWMIVESFKNPLEEADVDPQTEKEQMQAASRAPPPPRSTVKVLKEDLSMFDSVYYSSPVVNVQPRYVQSARHFASMANDDDVTALQVWHVRRDVLRAQKQIYHEMEEEDWPAFKESDLFLKAVQDLRPDPNLAAGLASSVAVAAADLDLYDDALSSSGVKSPRTPIRAPKAAAAAHADLFGTDMEFGQETKKVDLFGDKLAGSRSKASSKAGNLDILIGGRTQHAGPDGRTPLFREDPLFDEADDDPEGVIQDGDQDDSSSDFVQVEKMDEIQSALQNIIDEDIDRTRKGLAPAFSNSMRKTSDQNPETKSKVKKIFDVVDTASNAQSSDDPDSVGSAGKPSSVVLRSEDDAEPAPTNDLSLPNLAQEIRVVSEKLEKLESQADILDALIRKAELTGARAGEMRLLNQSSRAVRREARELRWQRDQFEKQLADSRLVPGHTQVVITGSMISVDDEGKEYAVYLIEVSLSQPKDKDRSSTSTSARGWIVGRRYSEFWSLHQSLKERYPEVKALENEFPGKRLVGLVHAPFVDARKAALERYLQALVKLPTACESEELRLFLSQSPTGTTPGLLRKTTEAMMSSMNEASGQTSPTHTKMPAFSGRGLVKTLFKGMTGVAEGLDDLIGIGPSMLDVVVQRLSSQVQVKSNGSGSLVQGIADIDMVSQAMNENATAAELREAAGAGTTHWTEPICDLFVELFELKQKNNWLRRQAIVILLQQLFGSTVERKVRETFSNALAPSSLTNYLTAFQNGLWPNGQPKEPTPPRTQAEKDALRENANRKLSTLIPELAANFVGRENARRGTRKVFSALQNKRLNKHLIYTLFDLCVDEMLAGAKRSQQQRK